MIRQHHKSAFRTSAIVQDGRLGQLDDIGNLQDLVNNIESLLGQVKSDDPKWAQYSNELNKCLDAINSSSLISFGVGGKCLYDLYRDIKDHLEEKEKEAAKPAPSTTVVVQKSTDWVPILLVGAAAIGVTLLVTS